VLRALATKVLKRRYAQVAKALYADDDLEFDDKPAVSIGAQGWNVGAFVQCWRWVSYEEVCDTESRLKNDEA
jgi:hypothetical protein